MPTELEIEVATKTAFNALKYLGDRPVDLSRAEDLTEVMVFTSFDLKAVVEAVLDAAETVRMADAAVA